MAALLFYFATILIAGDLSYDYSVKTDYLDEVNYSIVFNTYLEYGISSAFQYNSQQNVLVTTYPVNSNSIRQGIIVQESDNNLKKAFIFNRRGKFLRSIGDPNSYRIGGLISPSFSQINHDTLMIVDRETSRMNFFKLDGSFLNAVDYEGISNNFKLYFKGNKIFYSYPSNFLIETENSIGFGLMGKNDTDDSKIFIISDTKEMLSAKHYRQLVGESYSFRSHIYEVVGTSALYATAVYSIKEKDVFVANSFGNILHQIIADSLKQIVEIAYIEELHKLELSNPDREIQHGWLDRYFRLESIFNTKSGLLLYYPLTKFLKNKIGKKQLIYLINPHDNSFKEIIINKKIIPIGFDWDFNKLVCVSGDNETISLDYYSIND